MVSHRSTQRSVVLRWLPALVATLAVIALGIVLSGFHGPRPKLADPSTVVPAAQVHTPESVPSTPADPSTSAVPPAPSAPPAPRPPPAPPSPCLSNSDPQRIIVSIAQQHAWMCAGARQIADSAATTGATALGEATPTGTWHIEAKQTNTTLTVLTGEPYPVAYWLPYDGNLYGFHDSSWQTFPYGSPRYRTDGSPGCVHLPLAVMRWLFGWAKVGATVTIRA